MFKFDEENSCLIGSGGTLCVHPNDEVTRKFVMLFEGECGGLGATRAAKKHGYTKQRYFQILKTYQKQGAGGLLSKKRGPKGKSCCTQEVVRQVIRHRFLDPEASGEVIAQKMKQSGFDISSRSVLRVFNQYGLEKKTP